MNEYPEGDSTRWEEAKRVSGLIAGFLSNSLSESQKHELNEWIGASDRNQLLFEELTDKKNLEASMRWIDGLDAGAALDTAKNRIANREQKKFLSPKIVFAWMAAASLLVVGIVFWTREKPETLKDEISVNGVNSQPDILPGNEGAVLVLADGSEQSLGAGASDLPVQGNAMLGYDKAGSLQYRQDFHRDAVAVYNKLITARGKQYRVALSDGTVVWLNAASSIYYPAAFVGAERSVELTGEAFFDVAHDPGRPFIVKVKGHTIKVLGTAFNINAYDESAFVNTTLLRGSVQVTDSTNDASIVLSPGESALTKPGENKKTVVDSEQVFAWKNGYFMFHDAPIGTVMAQISRWYDVEIVYARPVDNHFNGTISRNVPVSQLLRLLEGTGGVHFTISDKKIIVQP